MRDNDVRLVGTHAGNYGACTVDACLFEYGAVEAYAAHAVAGERVAERVKRMLVLVYCGYVKTLAAQLEGKTGSHKANANNDEKEYSSLLDWGLRLTFMLALPASVMLMTLPVPFTATLFHYGKFSAHDVVMTSHALIAYGVGLIGLIVVRILAPGFYAKQDIRTPVKIAVVVLVLTQLMNLVFVPIYDHAGLALSIGIGACGNAAILYVMLRRRGIYQPQAGWRMFFVKVGAALVLLAGASMWVASCFDWIAMQATPLLRVGAMALVMVVCGIVYFGTLFALGFRLRDFRRIAS